MIGTIVSAPKPIAAVVNIRASSSPADGRDKAHWFGPKAGQNTSAMPERTHLNIAEHGHPP